jgi:hypothetical protein
MNDRQRALAVLTYQPCDRLPIAHFGFWKETLQRWAAQGHIPHHHADGWQDGNEHDVAVTAALGFDFNYYTTLQPNTYLDPAFEEVVLEETPEGYQKVRDVEGVVVLRKANTPSIPTELDHTLKTRTDWEQHYKPRMQFDPRRVDEALVRTNDGFVPFAAGGADFLRRDDRDFLYGLHCGSLFGRLRNIAGIEGISYLYADDEHLFTEMIDTIAELCHRCTEAVLAAGARFDFAHFWEDICFRSGPLVIPSVFEEKVGPHYKRITDLCRAHDIHIVSLDCDGCIDALIPTWFHNGVNTMFPIEVGTWNASIAPWRTRYGRELRGVGGMNKTAFARDRAAVDAEIERLRPLVDLGGYLPCPDHRIAPDAEWDNVRYYGDRMRQVFG